MGTMLRSLGTWSVCALWLTTATACFENTDLPDGITEAAGTDTNVDGGDGDATTADTTDTGADTGPTPATCMDYCGLMSACNDDFPQYGVTGPCLEVCAHMDLGNIGDQTGNTIGCRMNYAINASEGGAEKEANCRRAGPTGGGACGSPCESFCEIIDSLCVDANQQFSTVTECLDACAQWPDMPLYDANVPEADTYACRMKHLTYASLAPNTHCSHAQDVSPVCM